MQDLPTQKGHSLVCQVSAGCRSSPGRLETDDDLIWGRGVAREQALVEGVSAGVEGEKAKGEGPASGSSSLATP